MNRLAIFSLAMLISLSAAAQTVKVSSKANRVKGSLCSGFTVDLDAKSATVEDALVKFLKDYGKPRATTDYVWVSAPVLGGSTYEGKTLYGTVSGDDKKAQVWLGIDTAEWKQSAGAALERIEKMAYQFAVNFYRDQIQKEIDESQRALEATEKQKTRLTNQAKDLNLQLGNNEQERLHLEKQLEGNAFEKAVLSQKIINNKKSQDSVASAGLLIKKVLESQKEKQKKVN